jgi:hypothetical protein
MTQPAPLDFFASLVSLDGRPLLDTIERYRRRMFTEALFTFDLDGRPTYARALVGRSKKNFKTTDLTLAALYRFLAWWSLAGNDCLIVANDEDQAGDDLSLVKKLIAANPILDREVKVYAKEIARNDGRGTLKILPARDVAGAHGKTYLFLGIDEIHEYRDYSLIEALSPDPTRRDAFVWITSYNTLRATAGIPLFDLLQRGKAGTDPRMFFQWYGADYTTDPDLQGDDIAPEQRANPSMASWETADYLDQQRALLPSGRYRRLHLNLPGSPEGAAFAAEAIQAAIVPGRKRLPYQPGVRYVAAVDMSGGSNDDATFAIAHRDPETGRAVLDVLVNQGGKPPFNARRAIRAFAALAYEYRCGVVTGDDYAGLTYKQDFDECGLSYDTRRLPAGVGFKSNATTSASDFYEALEPRLNAGEIELLDLPTLQDQLQTLVWKGAKITHESGNHDDWANATAIALILAAPLRRGPLPISADVLTASTMPAPAAVAYLAGRRQQRSLADLPVDASPQEKFFYMNCAEAVFGPDTPDAAPTGPGAWVARALPRSRARGPWTNRGIR